MVENATVFGISDDPIIVLRNAIDTSVEQRIIADVCFDSKRLVGCYSCPLYKCAKRDL
ncbi:MAG: hypothetical protein ACETV1_05070 [Candidatus Bathyarchaeia archaeon]